MKALTIKQPWASLVVCGQKRLENRSWISAGIVGERFAIHAGKEVDRKAFARLAQGAMGYDRRRFPFERIADFPTSAIVGLTTITRIVAADAAVPSMNLNTLSEDESRWRVEGSRYGLVLGEAEQLEVPVACKGALGFWEVPEDIVVAISFAARRPPDAAPPPREPASPTHRRSVPGGLCAVCSKRVPLRVERPLGKDDAIVRICLACDHVHPRSGRYTFDKGEPEVGVGPGNHRHPIRDRGH